MGYLAIDVGGTKTEIAYFEELKNIKFVKQERFESKKFSSLEEIISNFIDRNDLSIKEIAIGIAGPVIDQICYTTNLPWVVKADEIKSKFKLEKVILINDLVANAYGIEAVSEEDKIILHPGKFQRPGNKAMISPGTGLGEAGIFFDGHKYIPFPTEGGHCDFAPVDDEQIELLKFLNTKFSHVSFERILSGAGFSNIYDFYTNYKNLNKVKEVEEIKDLKERPKIITTLAIEAKEPTCKKVVELFIKILAAESSNLALKMYSIGGLYIGGGILPKILPLITPLTFKEAFEEKGRFSSWLKEIAVIVINDDKTALKGAALSLKYK